MSILKQIVFASIALLSLVWQPLYAADAYQLDPHHSFVNYKIRHFDFSSQTGKWAVEGTLMLDKADPKKSKVDVTINIANVITGITELDNHLKGPLFFNVKKYPKATFVSTKVVPESNDKAKVYGDLTLKGVTKKIMLNVALNKHGVNPINDKMTAGFTATATLNRSDFGIKALLPGLGNKIEIDISAEASKKG